MGRLNADKSFVMKKLIFLLFIGAYPLTACTMFTAWRAIPAPGGCDECHKVPISSNWQLSYKPVALTGDQSRPSFQTEAVTMPNLDKPGSRVNLQKVEELSCFECHNSPDSSHKQLKGKFHH